MLDFNNMIRKDIINKHDYGASRPGPIQPGKNLQFAKYIVRF
jgi:hypothetical protein